MSDLNYTTLPQGNVAGKQTWIPIDTSSAKFRSLNSISDTKKDKFLFVESSCANNEFDKLRNDGEARIYFPVQVEGGRVFIKYFNILDPEAEVVNVMQVILKGKNGDIITVFGSKLSSKGIIWLAVFDKNCIVGIDVTTKELIHQFDNISSPNDLCINQTNEDIIIVAGGSRIPLPFTKQNKTCLSTPTVGLITRIEVLTGRIRYYHSGNLHSLAGITDLNGQTYITQLYEMRSAKTEQIVENTYSRSLRSDVVWEGNQVQYIEQSKEDLYYLSDNITKWDQDIICVACYRSIEAKAVKVMKNAILATFSWIVGKIMTNLYNFFTFNCTKVCSWDDPAVLLEFSAAHEADQIGFFLFNTKNNHKSHYSFNSKQLIKSKNIEFDCNVTHVERHAGKIAFINFKFEHILFLDESAVTNIASSTSIAAKNIEIDEIIMIDDNVASNVASNVESNVASNIDDEIQLKHSETEINTLIYDIILTDVNHVDNKEVLMKNEESVIDIIQEETSK